MLYSCVELLSFLCVILFDMEKEKKKPILGTIWFVQFNNRVFLVTWTRKRIVLFNFVTKIIFFITISIILKMIILKQELCLRFGGL